MTTNQPTPEQQEFTKKLEQLPEENQFLILAIFPNILNGSNWAILPEIKTQEEHNQLTKIAETKKGKIYQLNSGYLIFADFQTTINETLKVTPPGLVPPQAFQGATNLRAKHQKSFHNRITKGWKGKIGLYNINDETRVTVNGETFPAFNVTLEEAIPYLQNYTFIKDGQKTPINTITKISKALKYGTVAPSRNAIIFDIQPLT